MQSQGSLFFIQNCGIGIDIAVADRGAIMPDSDSDPDTERNIA